MSSLSETSRSRSFTPLVILPRVFPPLSDKMRFVGDTLFAGSIGRTDLPGGDYETLIRNVKEKIFPLGDDVVIYPGHGPKTTVGREKRSNPFFASGGSRWP